ncbi:unnamed protein product [Caenorhabditis auriculariae]|uniref:Protein-serine O-palmitoleoyltransferase porcupine n=1 Tax=Caenorhabditis auriculariae TaxID=2777116 RepID=A0A8S1H950_9PELO|nr:unnamed protein product [Caenorhabditis auriculariae]
MDYDIEEMEEYEGEEDWGYPAENPSSLAYRCSAGVLQSASGNLAPLIYVAFLIKFGSIFNPPYPLKTLKWLLATGYLISHFLTFEKELIYCFTAFLVLFSIASVPKFQYKGYCTLLAAISIIVSMNLYLPANRFVSVRGLFMLLAMKVTTVAFETEDGSKSIFETLAYVLQPALFLFGPWIPLEQFSAVESERQPLRKNLENILKFLALLLVSIFFLLVSSCGQTLLQPSHELYRDYVTAFAFRTSHYFIGFLTQALAALFGYSVVVCDPFSVEFPRSLVDVVVAWDVPMHTFLRKYVYLNCRKFGLIFAIFSAFCCQFSFSWSQLPIHGCFTITRAALRSGKRVEKSAQSLVSRFASTINAFFSFVTIYHLIYLGMPFTDDESEYGFSMQHTLKHWSRHYYASHLITFLFAAFTAILDRFV